MSTLALYHGELLATYGFGDGHPFGRNRLDMFWQAAQTQQLDQRALIMPPTSCDEGELLRFHTEAYIKRVQTQSATGTGFLDCGDTPAFPGIYEAGCAIVGTAVDATRRIMAHEFQRAFIPIAGLHHARRNEAGGFCVFNDCGVVIELLRQTYDLERIAYVDIDAHHGDGVFYSFESDPHVVFVDFHEDGRYLYPGTGDASETGTGSATGTKLNIPMPPGADTTAFMGRWEAAEAFLDAAKPQFILLQCGADSIAGDPITHMAYDESAHAHAARQLRQLADRHADGRLLAMGGGGYNLANIAKAWCAVVKELL